MQVTTNTVNLLMHVRRPAAATRHISRRHAATPTGLPPGLLFPPPPPPLPLPCPFSSDRGVRSHIFGVALPLLFQPLFPPDIHHNPPSVQLALPEPLPYPSPPPTSPPTVRSLASRSPRAHPSRWLGGFANGTAPPKRISCYCPPSRSSTANTQSPTQILLWPAATSSPIHGTRCNLPVWNRLQAYPTAAFAIHGDLVGSFARALAQSPSRRSWCITGRKVGPLAAVIRCVRRHF